MISKYKEVRERLKKHIENNNGKGSWDEYYGSQLEADFIRFVESEVKNNVDLGVVGKRTFLNDNELKDARQKIWNYLNEQHDVILLESDVDEILLYAKAIK